MNGMCKYPTTTELVEDCPKRSTEDLLNGKATSKPRALWPSNLLPKVIWWDLHLFPGISCQKETA